MRHCFDHVDLLIRNLAGARSFYETLLSVLGFTRDVTIEEWLQYEVIGTGGATAFFGMTESPQHVVNECQVSFWADSRREVDRLAMIMVKAGACNVEELLYEEPCYYCRLLRGSPRQSS